MTILEMLEILEAGVGNLQTGSEETGRSRFTPAQLTKGLADAELTKADFSALFSVRVETVDAWLAGQRPVPVWVETAVRIVRLLSPSARRALLQRPKQSKPVRHSAPSHPFARLEDL